MSATTIELGYTNQTQAEVAAQDERFVIPRLIGRVASLGETVAQAEQERAAIQARAIMLNAVELVVSHDGNGTDVNDERVDALLTHFEGDTIAASQYLLDVASALQAQGYDPSIR